MMRLAPQFVNQYRSVALLCFFIPFSGIFCSNKTQKGPPPKKSFESVSPQKNTGKNSTTDNSADDSLGLAIETPAKVDPKKLKLSITIESYVITINHNLPILVFTNDDNADLVYYEVCPENDSESCLKGIARDSKVFRPDLPVGDLELQAQSCVWEDRASTKNKDNKIVLNKKIAPSKTQKTLYCGEIKNKKFKREEIFNQRIDELFKEQYETQLDMDSLIYQAEDIIKKYSEETLPTSEQCADKTKSVQIQKMLKTSLNLRESFHKMVNSSLYDDVRDKLQGTSQETPQLGLAVEPPPANELTKQTSGTTETITTELTNQTSGTNEETKTQGNGRSGKGADGKQEGMQVLTGVGATLLAVGTVGLLLAVTGLVAKKITIDKLNKKLPQSGLDLTMIHQLPDKKADLDAFLDSHLHMVKKTRFDVQKVQELRKKIEAGFPYEENIRKFKDIAGRAQEGKLKTTDIDELIDMKVKLRESGFTPTAIFEVLPPQVKAQIDSEIGGATSKAGISGTNARKAGVKAADVADGIGTHGARALKDTNLKKTVAGAAGAMVVGIGSMVVAQYALSSQPGDNGLTCADSFLLQDLAPIELQLDSLRAIYNTRGLQLIDAISREEDNEGEN